MKSSRYNHFFDIEGGMVLAYNSYTSILAEIEKENYDRARHLLKHPDDADTPQDHEFLHVLKEGGFLIADAVDEMAVLREKSRRLRLQGSALTLTIAPTLACNFNCDYCFESRSNVRMSEDTQEALLEFSDHHLNRAEGLRVCWFGGEPTLCFPLIERLQSRLLELAHKHQSEIIPGMIITNGYLLDADMARRLKELGIAQAQITIDGPEKIHDSRRKLHSGKGTFKRIIDNLSETAGILNINIRINVDRNNVDSAYHVVELLRERGILQKVNVHFAQVTSSGSTCADVRDRCYSDEEFSLTQVDIYKRLHEKGIYQTEYPRVFHGAAICGAMAEGYFVVSPTGHLFRCWEELSLDSEKSVGDIFSAQPGEDQRKHLEAYRSWNPFSLAECVECDIFPICMGGCPLRGIQSPEASKGACLSWKYNLRKMIELKYLCDTRETVSR